MKLLAKRAPQTMGHSEEWLPPAGILRQIPLLLIAVGAVALIYALTADWLGMGGLPGIGARQIALALSGAALLLAGITLRVTASQQRLTLGLLMVVATISAMLVADMLVLNTGLATMLDKQVLLAAVVASVFLAGMAAIDENDSSRTSWFATTSLKQLAPFSILALQLYLLVIVTGQYALENATFAHNMIWLTFAGFLIHFFLPLPYRLPFFVLLSLAAIIGVFGLTNGLWLIALGLGLIGLCHLPLAYPLRLLLVLLAVGVLVWLRSGLADAWVQTPWSAAIWPILGSMFMFRLILYLYELRLQKEPFIWSRSLAYFFLLPNVVFPLFPVVDFSTFRRTYYNEDRMRIYQTGLNWMVRGVIQLVIYRYISYYWLIGPEDATNTAELMQYIVTNFLLYLRVSGQFHLIIGMLHLFGFNLPETHHLYFLASSFTDFWRRINIYWKDFMLKVFFYPTYFHLKGWGATTALVLTTLLVFVATWFLHAYQWFWLRGSFLLAWQDIIFWLILALLVVVNSLYEVKRGRKRSLGTQSWSWGELSSLSLRTAATFLLLCVLWSLWTSTSVAEWISLWSVLDFSWQALAAVTGVFAIMALITAAFYLRDNWPSKNAAVNQPAPNLIRSATVSFASLLFLYLLSSPSVYAYAGGQTQKVLRDLTIARLNDQDAELLERGYYEDLMGVNRFNSQLWEIYAERQQVPEVIWESAAVRPTGQFPKWELVPSAQVSLSGESFSTNRWGMRDQEYEKERAPNVLRTAFIGTSHVMGLGVADNETFEWLLEERMNDEVSAENQPKYEFLNFGTFGYTAMESLWTLENRVMNFQPDVVFYVAHPGEEERIVENLVELLGDEVEIPFDFVNRIIQQAEVTSSTPPLDIQRRLLAVSDEFLSQSYARFVASCQQQVITPVWMIIPGLVGESKSEEASRLAKLAEEAGFVIINLQDIYDGIDIRSIRVSPADMHPNALGHRMMMEQLYHLLHTAPYEQLRTHQATKVLSQR